MKKFAVILLAVLVAALSAVAAADTVDAYTSASTTKTTLEGEALTDALALLATRCSDLATLAQASEEGYARPEGASMAEIMTVNPDGSIGVSTITEWQLTPGDETTSAQVKLQLTHGQNALNLCEEGARGTLMVNADDTWYILHLAVTSTFEQVYDEDSFNAGEFNQFYSGAPSQLSSYDIYCSVLSIETSNALIF